MIETAVQQASMTPPAVGTQPGHSNVSIATQQAITELTSPCTSGLPD